MSCPEKSRTLIIEKTEKIEQELAKANVNKHSLLQFVSQLKSEFNQLWSENTDISSTDEMQPKYEFIVNNVKEFMSLIDHSYHYVAVNDSYCFAHNKKRTEIIGKSLAELWGQDIFDNTIKQYIDNCFSGEEIQYEEWFEFPALGRRFFDVRYYPYYGKDAKVTHVVVITHDITKRKNAEISLRKHQNHLEDMVNERTHELEEINQKLQAEIIERKQMEERQIKLITDLKDALQNINRLQGLIPICANCKKMRDDKGYWEEVEAYIQDHSDAEFTHGICPDCMKELYPQFANKQKDSDQTVKEDK